VEEFRAGTDTEPNCPSDRPGHFEVGAEIGDGSTYGGDGAADGPGRVDPDTLGPRARGPVPSAQPDRRPELVEDRFHLEAVRSRPLEIVGVLGAVDLILELGDPAAVLSLDSCPG
jgi:hypothetical protein